MFKQRFLLLPLLVCVLGAGTAHAAHTASRIPPACVLTIDHGFFSAQIELDQCARDFLAAGGTDLSQFQVQYKENVFGVSSYASLTPQAQQAVKATLATDLTAFQQDIQRCPTTRLIMDDSWATLNQDWGDPSQWVIDHLPSASIASGC